MFGDEAPESPRHIGAIDTSTDVVGIVKGKLFSVLFGIKIETQEEARGTGVVGLESRG